MSAPVKEKHKHKFGEWGIVDYWSPQGKAAWKRVRKCPCGKSQYTR